MGRLSREHQQAREAAKAAGLKVYQGKNCPKCEGAERYISNGSCVSCAIQRVKHQYWSDPEFADKVKSRAAQRQRDDRVRSAVDAARHRAQRKGLSFEITIEDVTIPEACPVLGIPLDWRDREHTPSLDRIHNDWGYVRGNVAMISSRANRIKADATIAELQAILAYMQRNLVIVPDTASNAAIT